MSFKVEVTSRSKIKDLEELAGLAASRRVAGKKVVHCHGVFDLVHVGHIRHLAEARKWGDTLLVTITPDCYVNKGPHRPAFPQDLRAEVLASLGCVDYVAINRWPTAVEAIEMLKPDFYVKGPDYRDAQQDRTRGITAEERAVRVCGGQIAFTDDITFSSSQLINRHLPVFPPEVKEYLARFSARYSAPDIIRYLDGLRHLKVVVVGEAIIDEYQYCEAIGKSSKEPILAVKLLETERFPGGILAVANHVAGFVDNVSLVTFLGVDSPQEEYVREKLDENVDATLLYRKNSPTLVKRRFVESYFFSKMLEVYEMNDRPLDEQENRQLCAALYEKVPAADIVILVDFGHGIMSQQARDIVCSKSRFLALNAQSNAANLGYHSVSKYRRADYISLTEGEIRLESRDRQRDLKTDILDVARQMEAKRVSVTRGMYGCICYSEAEGFFEVPAFAGQVVDRVGAGDAFLSVTALCAASKVPAEVVGFIGNAVGGQAVATVGNRAPVRPLALHRQIESLLK